MRFRVLLLIALAGGVFAQTNPGRPALLFREDFKETPAATPITQEHLTNPAVLLGAYGPGKDGLKKSHHDTPADDPFYVWDGTCEGNCAATVRSKGSFADMSGLAKIRWRTKQSGFRRLHLVLKLAGGTWVVSEPVEGASADWRETEIAIADLRWRRLDIKTMVEGAVAERPDLSRVDEIGWTTLMTGGGTPASSRVDWIEVYARAVPR